jgi:hypothetical protein
MTVLVHPSSAAGRQLQPRVSCSASGSGGGSSARVQQQLARVPPLRGAAAAPGVRQPLRGGVISTPQQVC